MTNVPPVLSSPSEGGVRPVAPFERIETLDVLRGFALFGILLVNMTLFGWPIYATLMTEPLWTERVDVVADGAVRWLVEGKFFPLFSFLFGLGMGIQAQRAAAGGTSFVRHGVRRLLVLLGFGVAHALLIWEGDILVVYALLGLLLLLFRSCRPRTLVVWAGVLLGLTALGCLALWALMSAISLIPEAAQLVEAELAGTTASYAQRAEENLRVFAEGSFPEIMVQRARNVAFAYGNGWFFPPMTLAMFLLGSYAARRGLFRDRETTHRWARRAAMWGLLLGLPVSGFYAVGYEAADPSGLDPLWGITLLAMIIGGPVLCLGYAGAVTLLLRNPRWQRRLRPIGAVGRLALSNYLIQSVVCTTLHYSYGLGWYGSVGRAEGLGLAVIVYAAQTFLSVRWLRTFRFGPAEWLWRRLSYGRSRLR